MSHSFSLGRIRIRSVKFRYKNGSAVSTQCKLDEFRVISLKFCGKSDKFGGVWTSRISVLECMSMERTHVPRRFCFQKINNLISFLISENREVTLLHIACKWDVYLLASV